MSADYLQIGQHVHFRGENILVFVESRLVVYGCLLYYSLNSLYFRSFLK